MNNEYEKLEASIGCSFRNKSLIAPSLVHPSYRHENSDVLQDNQRLEFLGDAALDLVAAEHLYRHFDIDEGIMTKMRSGLICTSSLAELARTIGLGNYLMMGRGERESDGANRDSNLADTLEALIGAAFIDGGIDSVRQIFETLFIPRLDEMQSIDSQNPKGMLQEMCQKSRKGMPCYHILSECGPSHNKTFVVAVNVDGVDVATGTASSKSKAEREAAVAAIKAIEKQ